MARPDTLSAALPSLRAILRRFRPYLRKHVAITVGAFAALFAEVGLRLLEPWPLKFVFDNLLGASSSAPPNGIEPQTLLALAAVGVVLLTAGRAVVAYLSAVGFALVGQRVLTEIRGDLFRHLQRLSLDFHARARGGDLTMRVISDVGVLKDVAVTAALPLLGNVLVLLGMIAVMFWMNVELALLAIAVLPLLWLRSLRLTRRIRQVSREVRRREGAMAATTSEALGSIRLVQSLSLEKIFDATFAAQNSRSFREGAKTKRLEAGLERTVDALIAVATALVLWYGARLALLGILTPGDLLVFLTYLKNAFKPIRDFAKYTSRLAKASAAGERIIELLDVEPEIRDRPGAARAIEIQGDLRFEGVSFAYPGGGSVLRAFDLDVPAGSVVALVGPSGIGKSTVAGLLLRLYDPGSGRITLDGTDLRDFTLESLRAQISGLTQDPTLFAVSIRENIAYGSPGATDTAVEAAARLANADDFIRALPAGYDTVVGERGVTLSTGQRQRIALARAAIRKAPVLILDEPTIGLDEISERAVIAGIRTLARSRTTLLITHDLRLASLADRIHYLEGGRVVELGSHEELLRTAGRYSSMYRMQAVTDRPRNTLDGPHAVPA